MSPGSGWPGSVETSGCEPSPPEPSDHRTEPSPSPTTPSTTSNTGIASRPAIRTNRIPPDRRASVGGAPVSPDTSTTSTGIPRSISLPLAIARASSRLARLPAVVDEMLPGGMGGAVHRSSQGASSSSPGKVSRTASRSRHISAADG